MSSPVILERRTVLVHEGSFVTAALGRELHVDVRVFAMVFFMPGTGHEQRHVAGRAVLQAMPITFSGLESGAVAGPQQRLARVVDQHDFALQHVGKLVFMRMPMALARPGPGRESAPLAYS